MTRWLVFCVLVRAIFCQFEIISANFGVGSAKIGGRIKLRPFDRFYRISDILMETKLLCRAHFYTQKTMSQILRFWYTVIIFLARNVRIRAVKFRLKNFGRIFSIWAKFPQIGKFFG
jgi:hypothetical protein